MRVGIVLGAVLTLVLGGCVRQAQRTEPAPEPVVAIIPVPQSLRIAPGQLQLDGAVALDAAPGATTAAPALRSLLAAQGIAVRADARVRLSLRLEDAPRLGAEGYTLRIDDGIALSAPTDTGLFHAVQSLRQLLPATRSLQTRLPHLQVADWPTLAWRGSSIDVARSFLPLDYLYRHVDRMALFKLNRLHLHLTDDQGWRVEIKHYPRLAGIGGASAVKGGRSGFYTQDELRRLVAYAAARHVTIVPEVDLPSHVQAAIAAYPELACDDVTNLGPYDGLEVGFNILCLDKPDVVYPFVREVLAEIAEIFPSTYIHVGGDEIKHPLYANFVARATRIVNGLGRTAVVWEEGSVAASRPDTLLQLWNDDYDIAPAVARGHALILSPCAHFYLDHGNYAGQPETYAWCREGGVPLRRVYAFDPERFPQVAGVEAALWSELAHGPEAVDNRLWPRLAAVAELGWSPAGQRGYGDFLRRLHALRPQFDALGIHYYAGDEVWDAAQP